MRLNCPASASSSSPVWTSIGCPRSPAPILRAPSSSVRIGRTMPRASASAASAEITKPATSSAAVRRIEASRVRYTSDTGCSTNTIHPGGSIGAKALST
jgi:hypothetical protein